MKQLYSRGTVRHAHALGETGVRHIEAIQLLVYKYANTKVG